jgi:excisionase family DNA binding protein
VSDELVHTSEAAKVLGISARSIARWAAEGRITPDLKTPGGHMRWNIDGLRRQLRELDNGGQRTSDQE